MAFVFFALFILGLSLGTGITKLTQKTFTDTLKTNMYEHDTYLIITVRNDKSILLRVKHDENCLNNNCIILKKNNNFAKKVLGY